MTAGFLAGPLDLVLEGLFLVSLAIKRPNVEIYRTFDEAVRLDSIFNRRYQLFSLGHTRKELWPNHPQG